MSASTIELQLNGKSRVLPAGLNLVTLLEHLEIDRRLVAVALNDDVITKDRYEDTALQPGDRVEIVRMVGGG